MGIMSNYNDYNNYNNYNPGPGPGPGPGRRPPQDNSWEGISWIVDVAMIFAVGPLGMFLTIAHAAGHDIVGGILSGILGPRRSQNKTANRSHYTTPQGVGVTFDQAQESKKPAGVRRADGGATVKTVFGWILVVVGLIGVLDGILGYAGLWNVLTMLASAIGGGALLMSARQSRKKEAKFRRCMTISGTEGVVDIRKLAKTMGMNLTDMDELLCEMVDRGYYGDRAYVDQGRRLLVIDVEQMRDIYRQEDEAKAAKQATEQARKDAETREQMSEYERYVELIRQADIDIADEVMSEKIRRMQNITAAIFREVEEHPEKKSQIDRFMNYYLPTTLKLLNSYARIEAQGVSGENMAKAKADIEGIADTLVAGYERQLDRLYRAEAIDIAGDVSVIENMLKRDGLAGENEFGQQTMGGH